MTEGGVGGVVWVAHDIQFSAACVWEGVGEKGEFQEGVRGVINGHCVCLM